MIWNLLVHQKSINKNNVQLRLPFSPENVESGILL